MWAQKSLGAGTSICQRRGSSGGVECGAGEEAGAWQSRRPARATTSEARYAQGGDDQHPGLAQAAHCPVMALI